MGYIDESERGLIGHLQNLKKNIRTFQKEVRITGKKMLCFYADNKSGLAAVPGFVRFFIQFMYHRRKDIIVLKR